jgi:hypothetical protein
VTGRESLLFIPRGGQASCIKTTTVVNSSRETSRMAEKPVLKPERTDAETDAALARAYALLIRAAERAAQAGIQDHNSDGQDREGDSDEILDGRRIGDKTRSTRT